MAPEEEKKSIFDKVVDAVSNRDEKAALDAAKQQAMDAEERARMAESQARQLQQQVTDAQTKADEMEKKFQEAQAKAQSTGVQMDRNAWFAAHPEYAAAAKAAMGPKIIKEHTLAAGETLSDLALKYYGHATPAYWQLIIDANKDIMPEDMRRITAGMVFKIPELPAELKKK